MGRCVTYKQGWGQGEAREVPGHKIEESTHSQGCASAGSALKKYLPTLCVLGIFLASCFQGSLATLMSQGWGDHERIGGMVPARVYNLVIEVFSVLHQTRD